MSSELRASTLDQTYELNSGVLQGHVADSDLRSCISPSQKQFGRLMSGDRCIAICVDLFGSKRVEYTVDMAIKDNLLDATRVLQKKQGNMKVFCTGAASILNGHPMN